MKLEDMSVVFLATTGAAGSFFMQSLFDSHPEVFMIPGLFEYPDLYETLDGQDQPNVVQSITDYYSNILKKRTTSIHGNFTAFDVSDKVFKEKLTKHYDPKISTSRDFVYAVHHAFAAATNANMEQKKVLFIHVHHLTESSWVNRLQNDFPEAKYIYMVRRPAQMIYSFVNSHLRFLNISLFESCFPFLLTLQYLEGFPRVFDSMAKLEENSLICRLEDLHQNFEKEIYRVAYFAGVDRNPVLFESTLGNAPLIYSSPNNRNLKGQDTRVVAPRYKDEFSNDEIRFLETVFKVYMLRSGYDFETAADFTLAEATALFVTKKSTSLFHPKFYFPVKKHHYEDAIAARNELVGDSFMTLMHKPSQIKSLFISFLGKIGIGSILYSLATYKRNLREFRQPGMQKLFQQLNVSEKREVLLRKLLK
jgi:hypothetical protein